MKLVTIVGARPQFVKASVVSRSFATIQAEVREIIVHTGQHYDINMSEIFFDEMDIPRPDYSLGVGGGTHGAMTGRQLEKIEGVLLKERPDRVLVYGDTNSTIAGALAAIKLHIPVSHVEAGLRSFNRAMPEEINRILVDQISDQLFCPTKVAVDNLVAEGFGVRDCKIHQVGDVMYDAALYYRSSARQPGGVEGLTDFALVTLHRAENTDNIQALRRIVLALNELAQEIQVVCPLHPRTRAVIERLDIDLKITVIDPVGYFEMIWLVSNCRMVLTDSGGLQKEAYFFNRFCITLREQTEWTELIDAGANVLVGSDPERILAESRRILSMRAVLSTFNSENIYGNGDASKRIIDLIAG